MQEFIRNVKNNELGRMSATWTYMLLSVAFVALNFCTLKNLLPWIDEVMLLDTAYNAAFRGMWETTAWYRVAGQTPFSTYPPLYQWLIAVWMRLFGGSLVAARSLNLLFTFALGAASLRLLKRRGMRLTHGSVAVFSLLLWGTCEMAWMYRNGRPDVLCALLTVLTFLALDSCLFDCGQQEVKRMAVVVCSAALVCAGLQAGVYLLTCWTYIFIVWKERRRDVARLLCHVLTGFLLGGIIVSLFMFAHGRLMVFVCSVVPYSSTLSRAALHVLPWMGKVLGFSVARYTTKLLELQTDAGICESLASATEYRSFYVLASIALAALLCRYKRHIRKLIRDTGFLTLLFAAFVPVAMNLAGRFTEYYRWMMFLPLLGVVVSISCKSSVWRVVFVVAAVVLSFSGVRSMLPSSDRNYSRMCEFVRRQSIKQTDAVVCPFALFYEMKPMCETCYFVGIYPTEYVQRVDYIIEATDGNRTDQPIVAYRRQLMADTTMVLTAIDSLEQPPLKIYRVKKKLSRAENKLLQVGI